MLLPEHVRQRLTHWCAILKKTKHIKKNGFCHEKNHNKGHASHFRLHRFYFTSYVTIVILELRTQNISRI
ncbi:hypothetical protein DMR_29020 [Solidesulfovibrio magneticus RS-1]|uniref:Uncharacterized protein n=1 Tax=Solidesulfovibrio magneticus (strain ATCC 700980 / DSM 13731 / RS-1) TaxID=573370 RepID=C4XHL9_SOLM1|nr:hypothetical protein DMR_29020 [Solidesulfovibrio magneticus RS-1]